MQVQRDLHLLNEGDPFALRRNCRCKRGGRSGAVSFLRGGGGGGEEEGERASLSRENTLVLFDIDGTLTGSYVVCIVAADHKVKQA